MPATCQELIEYMAKAIVNDDDQVTVRAVEGSTAVIYELSVAAEEMGRVIGRNGRVANAMRTIIRCRAARAGKRVKLEIVEPGDMPTD